MSTSPFYRPGNPFGGSYMPGINPGREVLADFQPARALHRQPHQALTGALRLEKFSGEAVRYAPQVTNTLASLRKRREDGKSERAGEPLREQPERDVSTIPMKDAPSPPLALDSPSAALALGQGAWPMGPGPIAPPAPAGRAPSGYTYRAAGSAPVPLNRRVTPQGGPTGQIIDLPWSAAQTVVPGDDRQQRPVAHGALPPRPLGLTPPPPPSHRRRT